MVHAPSPRPSQADTAPTTRQSLQTSAGILKHHASYLLENLNKHSALFQRLAIHPTTNYPGRTQEPVLMTLLRKKVDPTIETLVEAARGEALAAGISPSASFISQERIQAERERERQARRAAKFGFAHAEMLDDDDSEEDDDDDDDGSDPEGSGGDDEADGDRVNEPLGVGDVWVDSQRWCREQLARFAEEFGEDLYTAEERALGVENVRTGLRRSLEEEEESDEEEDDDDDDGGGGNDDDEGDTAMRDVETTTSGAAAGGAGAGAGESGPLPGADPECMLSFTARGDQEMPMAMLEAQRNQLQQRR